jgi:amino acid transporter
VALFQAMAVILIVACFGTGLAGIAGAARLLYGMGRDDVLPRRFFARVDSKRNIPAFNVVLIGLVTLLGALLISYERSAELLNFGAFLAFMGVNITCIRHFCISPQVGRRRNLLTDFLAPGFAFLFCAGIWWSLPRPARWAGGIWFIAGFIYAAIRTRGFRVQPPKMDFSEL